MLNYRLFPHLRSLFPKLEKSISTARRVVIDFVGKCWLCFIPTLHYIRNKTQSIHTERTPHSQGGFLRLLRVNMLPTSYLLICPMKMRNIFLNDQFISAAYFILWPPDMKLRLKVLYKRGN